MSKVALIGCKDYNSDNVLKSVKRGLDLLGGVEKFFKKGDKILVKPNMLTGEEPERAVTTNPEIFRAIVKILYDKKIYNISYGDSPALGNTDKAAKKSGLKEIAKQFDIKQSDFSNVVYIPHHDALLLKKLPIAKGVSEADSIVSLPKMKTHGLTRITGAVKNQFGCVPGILKGEFHLKMPDIEDFSKMLIDINTFLRPKLYIMDGITAMEGNGPRSGTPFPMNVILLSSDPVAMDSVFCRLIDLDPEYVPTMKYGKISGLGVYNREDIEIVGDNPEDYIRKDFKVKRKPYERFASKNSFPWFLKNLISPKPVINYDMCKNCGKCVIQCPTEPKAVNWKNDNSKLPPVHNYKLCIRCYCCQEICPYGAISIKTPILGKLIKR